MANCLACSYSKRMHKSRRRTEDTEPGPACPRGGGRQQGRPCPKKQVGKEQQIPQAEQARGFNLEPAPHKSTTRNVGKFATYKLTVTTDVPVVTVISEPHTGQLVPAPSFMQSCTWYKLCSALRIKTLLERDGRYTRSQFLGHPFVPWSS